jgi:SAM-dependent methyltransferase
MNKSDEPGLFERFDSRKNQLFLEKFSKSILDNVLKYVASKVILDAGCGLGWAEPILLENGAKHIDAFDIDDDAIGYATNQRIKNTHFEVRDFNKHGFKENYYDIAISVEVIEHLREYEFYLSNMAKSLKEGGIFFLSTPNKKTSGNANPYHLKEFAVEEMIKMLKDNSFEIMEMSGLSANELSKTWARFVPRKITSLVRKSFLYKILVDNLVKFENRNTDEAETLVYISRKK